MTERQAQRGQPDDWQRDLHPNFMAGQNVGMAGPRTEFQPSAYDLQVVHNRLKGLPDTDLKAIPVLAPGTRLEQGATYIDLKEAEPREFTARGDMEATEDHWYVAKKAVDWQLWNRLIGVDNPERLGNADER